jgi:hypothetical protein
MPVRFPEMAGRRLKCGLALDPMGQRPLWLNQVMFARKIRVEYEDHGQWRPCPLKWLDSFSMRNFTNASVFDDTLPVGDGQMEVGTKVPLDQLKDAMEDWLRRKGYLPKESRLSLGEG